MKELTPQAEPAQYTIILFVAVNPITSHRIARSRGMHPNLVQPAS